ncbi:F0F1 ATP synthase subunit epsilon [Anianabacter salinae]|uniref:F0F1 ATP synthase subunit epsilon n=1 Tax=Anianabacter salinae TaxID=2851023 RepID=UPI00225E4F07|nr:F0F1 ATP synthase subunit epsilon [Anianabacter salinae]MBV0912600.1 F0F1 ATP synthase subunit epsilon [Anianabacter salinae]
MADTMQFDLVSPERRLASGEATEVHIPGAEGDLTAMAGHMPLITTLRPGILRIVGPNGTDEYAVTGGFAEINAEGASILAEESLHVSDVTQEAIDRFMEKAAERVRAARDAGDQNLVDEATKLVADMVAMGDHIGLSPKQPSL